MAQDTPMTRWRKKNKAHLRDYHREYMRKYRKKLAKKAVKKKVMPPP